MKIDQGRTDPVLQQNAISYATNQTQALNLQRKSVAKNSALSDKAKLAYFRNIDAQQGRLDALVNAANSHLDRIESEAQVEQRESARDAKADAREAKQEARLQSQVADKAQQATIKAQQNAALTKLGDMHQNLYMLSQDPENNMPKIQKLAAALYVETQKAQDDGHLTPREAQTQGHFALQMAGEAALWQRKQPQIFGMPIPSLVQPKAKRQNTPAARQAQQQAMQNIVNYARVLKDVSAQKPINDMIFSMGGNGEARAQVFNQRLNEMIWSFMQQYGQPPKSENIEYAANKLRNRILQEVPANAPPMPKAPSTNLNPPAHKLVAPPPAVPPTKAQLKQLARGSNSE